MAQFHKSVKQIMVLLTKFVCFSTQALNISYYFGCKPVSVKASYLWNFTQNVIENILRDTKAKIKAIKRHYQGNDLQALCFSRLIVRITYYYKSRQENKDHLVSKIAVFQTFIIFILNLLMRWWIGIYRYFF